MFSAALADLHAGFWRHELWLTLGWRDVIVRYRRSRVGSIWITLSMLLIATVMGGLYSEIMRRPASEYIPYLLAGFMIWNLISSLISEGCQTFTSNAAAIKELPAPLTVFGYRLLWRNAIVLGYNMVAFGILLIVMGRMPSPEMLMAVPGLALLLLNGMWVAMLFGIINLRYRDFTHVVANLMRLIFFLTPVIWYADMAVGQRSLFVHFNPFYYFIEIVRGPLLGQIPSLNIWAIALVITLLGWFIMLPVFAIWRQRIAYWV